MTITTLISQLAAYESPNVFNPWDDCDSLDYWKGHYNPPVERQQRLAAHFDCRAEYLLIGEAPGYQGCRFSGIPFTSERLIHEGKIPRVPATRFTTRPKPWSEPSATIVWGALHELGIAQTTVLWNAFAWHPHNTGRPLSNRTPTREEFCVASGTLCKVLQQFVYARVVAVGENASRILQVLGQPHAKVRHPANGGAPKFREGLREIVQPKASEAGR